MLRIEKIFSYLQSKQCVFSFLICLPALFLIMSPLWAAGAPQQTVITVQGAPTQQNPSGLEQKLVTIPDSSKLQINPVNSTTPSSITVNAPKPLNLNPALSWGPQPILSITAKQELPSVADIGTANYSPNVLLHPQHLWRKLLVFVRQVALLILVPVAVLPALMALTVQVMPLPALLLAVN